MKRIKNSKYLVDEKGNVYNPAGKKLEGTTDHKGYLRVKVKINSEVKTRPIHRLVAETFIPNPDNKPQVNHIDGNKQNNHIINLEWCTPKENSRHAVDVLGLGRGSTHSQAIYDEETVHKICRLFQDGYRNCDISKELQIDKHIISQIRRRISWQYISDQYNFEKKKQKTISDETFLWICQMLEEGKTAKEIKNMYNGESLTNLTISNIRTRKMRPKLSESFNF